MELNTEDFYNLVKGGQFVLGHTRYLRQLFNEDDDAYQKRLKWATYPNYQKKIVNTYVGYVFHGKIVVEPEAPLEMERTARKLAYHILVGGVAYLFTTQERIKVFTALEVTESEDGKRFSITTTKGKWTIDTEAGTVTGPNKDGQEVIEKLQKGQFIRCAWNEDGQSLIEDTAQMNVELYNQKSQLQVHYDRGLFYFMYGPPLGKDNKLVSGDYIGMTGGEVPPGVVQVSAEAARQLRDEMQVIKMEMAITVALEQEFADQIKAESGVAIATRKLDTNAIVASIAFAVTTAMNEAAEFYASAYGKPKQTIKLDPFIKILEPADEQMKYKTLMEFAGTDMVAKQIQKSMIKRGLSAEVAAEIMDDLIKDIDANGGRKLFESTGFLTVR